MVKHLLIGFLGAVLVHSTEVFAFNAVLRPDPLIHAIAECLHRWKVCRDRVCGPHIRGGDSVQRKATGMYHIQHLQAVLTHGDTSYVLGVITFAHTIPSISAIALNTGKNCCGHTQFP